MKLYEINIFNPRTIIINPKIPVHKTYLDKYHIKDLNFNDNFRLKIGDDIPVDMKISNGTYKTYYKCNYIYKEDHWKIRINEFEENDASVYILPLLGLQKDNLLPQSNFINCYIQHYEYKHNLGDYIYLMYRYIPVPYYAKFITALQKQEDCVFYQKDKDKRFDCFGFKTKEKFKEDINLILKGKFSHISEEAKGLILSFHSQTNPETPLSQILYKGVLRRNELEEALGLTLPEDVDYGEMPKISDNTWFNQK